MKLVLVLSVAVAGVLGVSSVGAQTRYHCRDGNGNSFVLSRPCPADARTTAAVAQPVPSYQSSYARNAPTAVRVAPEAPAHHQYMSERCRSLDDNIRSAYSRRIAADVVAGMRREYERDCREQERDAYSQSASERRSRDKERREAEQSAQLTAQVAREQEERVLQQCAESRRILATKKARTDLTAGERNDLRRFEENFIARCKR
ncbi:MAG: hypothetical protein RBS27_01885 [Giesbergeria sp.]|jgi:hypothetical protein|nr:hypothetical protein [Giesbergeria sp.]